ncbi:hypothetical protein Emed_002306 [Eimeria media]
MDPKGFEGPPAPAGTNVENAAAAHDGGSHAAFETESHQGLDFEGRHRHGKKGFLHFKTAVAALLFVILCFSLGAAARFAVHLKSEKGLVTPTTTTPAEHAAPEPVPKTDAAPDQPASPQEKVSPSEEASPPPAAPVTPADVAPPLTDVQPPPAGVQPPPTEVSPPPAAVFSPPTDVAPSPADITLPPASATDVAPPPASPAVQPPFADVQPPAASPTDVPPTPAHVQPPAAGIETPTADVEPPTAVVEPHSDDVQPPPADNLPPPADAATPPAHAEPSPADVQPPSADVQLSPAGVQPPPAVVAPSEADVAPPPVAVVAPPADGVAGPAHETPPPALPAEQEPDKEKPSKPAEGEQPKEKPKEKVPPAHASDSGEESSGDETFASAEEWDFSDEEKPDKPEKKPPAQVVPPAVAPAAVKLTDVLFEPRFAPFKKPDGLVLKDLTQQIEQGEDVQMVAGDLYLLKIHLQDLAPGQMLDTSLLHAYSMLVETHVKTRAQLGLQQETTVLSPVLFTTNLRPFLTEGKTPELPPVVTAFNVSVVTLHMLEEIARVQTSRLVVFPLSVPLWDPTTRNYTAGNHHFILGVIDREWVYLPLPQRKTVHIVDSLPQDAAYYPPLAGFVKAVADQMGDLEGNLQATYAVASQMPEKGFPVQAEALPGFQSLGLWELMRGLLSRELEDGDVRDAYN